MYGWMGANSSPLQPFPHVPCKINQQAIKLIYTSLHSRMTFDYYRAMSYGCEGLQDFRMESMVDTQHRRLVSGMYIECEQCRCRQRPHLEDVPTD